MIEIAVGRFLANELAPMDWQGHHLEAREVTAAIDVVRALEDARARGERAVLFLRQR